MYPGTSDSPDGYAISCVSVRRGDKIGVNGTTPQGYSPWALSADYYHRAINLVKERNKKNVFIVFVGGSFDSKTRVNDRNWVTENLIKKFSDSNTVLLLEPEGKFKLAYFRLRYFLCLFTVTSSYGSFSPVDFSHFTVLSAMSQCDNLIVSSSSFSWWAAYLSSESQDRVCPSVRVSVCSSVRLFVLCFHVQLSPLNLLLNLLFNLLFDLLFCDLHFDALISLT